MEPPGRRAMTFEPTVVALAQERELRWRGRLLVPGLFDGEHAFRLEEWARGCRFHQTERFSGVPRIALTATADQRTRADILDALAMPGAQTFTASFHRPNLAIAAEPKSGETQQLPCRCRYEL